MATTTNYGWTTPNDTDLVKDGAAAIRTLGSSIDTTVFANAGAGIAKTIVDAKGDIIAATAADTVSRLAVGANNTVLTADSSTATGLKWAATASSAVVQVKTATTSTSGSTTSSTLADTGLSVSITPTSASNKILVLVHQSMGANSSATYPEPAAQLALFRDATNIYGGGGTGGLYFFKFAGGTTELLLTVPITMVDSPATTSAITYKTQYATAASSVTARIQPLSQPSFITVLEVTP